MGELLSLAGDNILSPPILFFALGFVAALLRSDLAIPETIGKTIALYLMFAIGFKGGASLATEGLDVLALWAALLGIAMSFVIPIVSFRLLRMVSRLTRVDAAAVSAHYGSVSVVTFVTAANFLDIENIPYEAWIIAVLALMETPAIVTGLALARERGKHGGQALFSTEVLREVLLNGSIVMLLGAFAIGWATGEQGLTDVAPFIVDPFKGVLCLFLLDMGLVAARQLHKAEGMGPSTVAFGLYMPIVGGLFGLLGAWAIGLSLGGTTLIAVLGASASYIAVPAALRMTLPQANAAIYLTMSLGITFPFNVLIGIPLYLAAAEYLYGVV
ncbi:MAG: sodium-dependent bicarbonate transport family permease [Rhodospirillales bacterium]|nr:sodium-dependent bicarbonate transport family permease [Rhodospirillales bacterium]